MEIVKVAFIAVLTVLFYALLRQIKPEIAPLVIIGGAAVIIIMLSESFFGVTSEVGEMISLAGIEKENVSVLLRSLGICVVTQFAANICYDNSCSSVAAAVELAGRLGAIVIAMPMIKAVAETAIGLLNS